MMRWTGMPGVAVSLLCHLALAAAPATNPSEKLVVPKSLEQIKPSQLVHTRYKADFAAHDAATRSALSQSLLAASKEPDLDVPTRWVLLLEAREQAVDAGDLNRAFAAIDAMNDAFIIDVRNMKVSAMSASLDKALIPPAALTENYLKLVEQFLNDGDIDLARNASQLASDGARIAHDANLRTRAKEADQHILAARREAAQVSAAIRKLKTNPADSESSLLVGSYACFVRGLWNQGIPFLAEGSNSTLKELARKELAGPVAAGAQAQLADGWWNYADTQPEPAAIKSRKHAATWYQKALPGLNGAQRDEATTRIAATSK